MMVEVLERAFADYERNLFSESSNKESKSNQNPPLSPQRIMNNYQPIEPNLRAKERELLNTELNNLCSFYTRDQQNNLITCNKTLFNKRKQLCRSHNSQVWKRFNKFLKPHSVSSTAAWLGIWEDSGDWKYFWDLGKEKSNQTKKNNSPIEAKYFDQSQKNINSK